MKNYFKGILFSFALFTALFLSPQVYAQNDLVQLEITVPTVGQTVLAPDRDIYVIGDIEGDIPEDARVSVSLFKDGESEPVREVYATQKDNKDGLYIDYPLLSYYGGEDRSPLRDSMMPDLVYDPQHPDSFKDAWRKLYYNDENFTAVLSGGVYDTDLNLVDEHQRPLLPLSEGEYTLVAEARTADGITLGKTEREITIGINDNVALFRFSPAEHYNKVIADAQLNHYNVLLDPLAGYWSPGDHIASLADSGIFAEILPRWRFNDLTEYRNNHAHFYAYNISATAATQTVEIGSLQAQNVIEQPDRFTRYYYDIGEPLLPNGHVEGQFKAFADSEFLALTRIDFQNGDSQDNLLVMDDLATVDSVLDLEQKVKVKANQTFSLYGVVTPIQNAPEDIIAHSDNTFTVNNRITTIEYVLTVDGISRKISKPVGLNRIMSGASRPSIYEFKHDFMLDDSYRGKLVTVTTQAYDSYGQAVAGTEQQLVLKVK